MSELSVTVWADEFFGIRITDNGWECHHYDEAIWTVLKERPPEKPWSELFPPP